MTTILNNIQDLFRGIGRFINFRRPTKNQYLSIGTVVAGNAEKYPDRIMVVTKQEKVTWSEFNARANQYAHFFKARGVAAEMRVSLLMENDVEMLAVMVAMFKLGAVPGLINTSLKGEPLKHCINIVKSEKVFFGSETATVVRDIEVELASIEFIYLDTNHSAKPEETRSTISPNLKAQPSHNLEETARIPITSPAYYIFTSGTTGLPKAAIVTHYHWYLASSSFSGLLLGLTPKDRTYVCLPLFHTAAILIGFGASCVAGSSFYLSRKFSASRFWEEVSQSESNIFLYIGELCRYLLNAPATPDDIKNPLTTCVGNGLRPELWGTFKERFNIKKVAEYYGSTEGNLAFMNVFNRDCTFGIGLGSYKVIRYDEDIGEIERDNRGFGIPCKMGETGLLINEINKKSPFNGYTDKKATKSKILRGVLKRDDCYFNTGDLIRQVNVGFAFKFRHFQFVDRVGDTFRWKGENVSTGEVSELVNGIAGVQSSCVYGVQIPATDGRAGMAAVVVDKKSFSIDKFSEAIVSLLPSYSQPIFIRLIPSLEITGTFKIKKSILQNDSYNIEGVLDPIFVRKPKSYVYEPLDSDFYQTILNGNAGF
jgi:citronellyl-CoA synthetase